MRPLNFLLVLVALTVRMAIPGGFMLSTDGALALVPCPEVVERAAPTPEGTHAAHAMPGHAPRGTSPDHFSPHGKNLCPFAAMSAPFTPAGAADVENLATAHGPIATTRVQIDQSTWRLAAPPPPPTGPPTA